MTCPPPPPLLFCPMLRGMAVHLAELLLENRRAATRSFNALLDAVQVQVSRLDPKQVQTAQLEKVLRLLNGRCVEGELQTRFANAVQKFVANHGQTTPDRHVNGRGAVQTHK